MKILLVNKYHYMRGGSETYYFGLAKLLKQQGHQVIFFAMEDEKNLPCEQAEYFVSHVEFNGELSVMDKLKAAGRMIYSFEAKKKMLALIDKEKPDIVHINLFHRVLTAAVIDAAKMRGLPVVFTMHDLNAICPNHTMLDHGAICEACLGGNYFNCVKRVCFKDSRAKCLMAALESTYNKISGMYRKIDMVITPSDFYKEKLLASGLVSCPVVRMRNFLPAETVYTRSPRGDYVLYFGRLSYEKGILTLVKAMKNINAPLVIVGTGPEEAAIREEAKRVGIENRVLFMGFQQGKDLTDLIRDAGVVVVPSEWYEASGYTACEAAALGKIVVAADAGGLPENLIDGMTGYVYPMGDVEALAAAIKRVRQLPPALYQSMADMAIDNAKAAFDPTSYVKTLLMYYSDLIKQKGNGR